MKEKKTYKASKLHSGQSKIVRGIINSNATFFIIKCPRQYGKSFMITQLILYYAINNNKSKSMYTAPTYSQCSKLFNELVKGIESSGIISSYNRAENSLTLINGSEIYFKSVQVPDNLRGYSIDYMFCDEAGMYKEGVFEAVLRPMLTVRGKKCILLSTPKGKNYFYKMYQLGLSDLEPRYLSFSGTSDDNPYANKEEIKDAKKALPENLFRQEYLAEFVDGGTVFPNLDKNAILKAWQDAINGERYYAGLDIALQNDYLVLTILNSKGEIVHCYRDNNKPMLTMVNNVKTILNKYNPQLTIIETNGIGNGGIFELLQKAHRSVEPFVTGNLNKQELVEDLIFDLQNDSIKIPHRDFFPYYIDEMTDFGFDYSPKTRRVTYNSISGHDDCVISLCLANRARRSGRSKGRYTVEAG